MIHKIEQIIIKSLDEICESYETQATKKANLDTKIFADDGILDSLSLVALISEVEERLENELNIQVTLADEKAMSAKNSPFKDVKSLSLYINEIL